MRFFNFDDFSAAFTRGANELTKRRMMDDVVHSAALRYVDILQNRAPLGQTGRLRKSFRARREGDGYIVEGAHYAIHVDRGGLIEGKKARGTMIVPAPWMQSSAGVFGMIGDNVTVWAKRPKGQIRGYVINKKSRQVVAYRMSWIRTTANPYLAKSRAEWNRSVKPLLTQKVRNSFLRAMTSGENS
jgi:hypothetical protein